MSKVCVFIDVAGQAIRIKDTYPGKKLDLVKYLNFCKRFGDVIRSFAYGVQFTEKSENFINFLKHTGYEPKFKTIDRGVWFSWDVGLCMDVVKMMPKCETIILGTSHKNMVPLVLWAKEQGVKVVIVACGINFDMKHACDKYIEVDSSLLTEDVPTEEYEIPEKNDGGVQGTREVDSTGVEGQAHSQQPVVQRDGGESVP